MPGLATTLVTITAFLQKTRWPTGRNPLGFQGGYHLLENKTLEARDKSISKCTYTLCKLRASLLPAIHALRGGKFNQ